MIVLQAVLPVTSKNLRDVMSVSFLAIPAHLLRVVLLVWLEHTSMPTHQLVFSLVLHLRIWIRPLLLVLLAKLLVYHARAARIVFPARQGFISMEDHAFLHVLLLHTVTLRLSVSLVLVFVRLALLSTTVLAVLQAISAMVSVTTLALLALLPISTLRFASLALLLVCNAPLLLVTALVAWQVWSNSKATAQVLAQSALM